MDAILSFYNIIRSVFWIVLIVFILIRYLLAREFQLAAEYKGYETKKYKWICFFFGIVGYLLVIALPDIQVKLPEEPEEVSNDTYDLPDL